MPFGLAKSCRIVHGLVILSPTFAEILVCFNLCMILTLTYFSLVISYIYYLFHIYSIYIIIYIANFSYNRF